jgi:diguanylate cyclase (GGDEF)-like protein/PAS domain S-box-containing protein
MNRRSRNNDDETRGIREKLIGLGERSVRKSYYPELVRRHEDLARFHTLLEHISDTILLLDVNSGAVVDAVGNTEGIAGRPTEEIIGANISEMVSEATAESLHGILESLIQGTAPETTTGYLGFNPDKAVPVEITVRLDEFDGVTYAIIVARDITQRIKAELALKASEERYRMVADYNYDWEVWIGPEGRMLYVSPSCHRITGYERDRFIEDPGFIEEIIHRDDLGAWKSYMAGDAAADQEHLDFRIFHRDGRMVWISQVAQKVTGDDGRPMGVRISLRDITNRKIMEKQLQYQALHDPLTGLANRTLCLDRVGQAMGRVKRREDYSFAVVFVDLDRFKVINDSLGHSAGDKLLVDFSQRLLQCVRNLDTVSRFGGDEFILLLEELTGANEALNIVKRVREEVCKPFYINGHEVQSTASFGMVLSPADYREPEMLLQNANIAMHRAKESGRNRIKVFNFKMLDQAVQAMTLETDLRRAVHNEEFFVDYQPLVSLKTGSLTGFEALVRWDHPRHGVLPPGRFIPLAEDTGIIVDIGALVLEEACRTMALWRETLSDADKLMLTVNLSAKQFNQPDLVQGVTKVLKDTNLPAENLKLEITESAIMDNPDDTAVKLARLKRHGIGVSIDDFGTGYSSMSHLQRFPLNYLKIDQNFVQNLDLVPENLAIVKAIIKLAHSLGLETIAEGVEKSSHVRILSSLKCEFAQGYFFSGPLSKRDAESLVVGTGVFQQDSAVGQ